MERQTFKDRLKILMDGEPPYGWAKKARIYKGLFQYYWQSGKIPAADTLIKIQNYTGCSLDWLVNGELPTLDYKVRGLRFSGSRGNTGSLQRQFVAAFGQLRLVFEKGSKADRDAVKNILSHMTSKKQSYIDS